MTDYGSGGGVSTTTVSAAVVKYTAVILAGQNSVTITHNLGRLAKTNEPYGTDDNVASFKIINEGINSFDVAFPLGGSMGTDTNIAGSYI